MKETVSEIIDEVEAGQDSAAQPSSAPNQVRTLAHPLDTVSSATREMFEVRSSKNPAAEGSSTSLAFKIIAVVAIVLLVAAIVASQVNAL